MRRLLLLLLVLLALPMVGAHGEAWDGEVLPFGSYLQHIDDWSIELAPGEAVNQTLAFGGAPLQESWLLMFQAEVNGSIRAELVDEGRLAAWTWQDGVFEDTIRVEHTGWPELRLHNDGSANATVRLFFDQTCDCIGKALPVNAGPLLFNVDAEAGQDVRFDMTVVPVRRSTTTPDGQFNGSMSVVIDRIRASADGSSYEILESWRWDGDSEAWDDCRGIERFHACLDVRFTAEEAGRQVVVLRSEHDMPDWSIQVRPIIEVGMEGRDAPSPGWLVMAAVGLVATGKARATRLS